MKLIDIAFDLDGVLVDVNPVLKKVLWEQFGARVLEDDSSWDIKTDPQLPDDLLWEAFHKAYEYINTEDIPIFPGAKELLRKLYDLSDNDPVKIVTARPPKKAANYTYKYVSELLCDFPYELVLVSDYSKLPYINRYKYFVEDKLTTAEHMAANNKKVFLIDRPHNQKKNLSRNIERLSGVHELLPIAEMFIKEV